MDGQIYFGGLLRADLDEPNARGRLVISLAARRVLEKMFQFRESIANGKRFTAPSSDIGMAKVAISRKCTRIWNGTHGQSSYRVDYI